MDHINNLALKIAEVAAPDEIDLAPAMVEAFVKGGKYKKDLFYQAKGGALGAFGPGEAFAVLPWLLQGLTVAAPILYTLLSSTTEFIANALSVINGWLDIRNALKQKRKTKELPDNPYSPLKKVIDTLSNELRKAGISEDQCDLITYRVLRILLEDPSGAKTFVHKLAESP